MSSIRTSNTIESEIENSRSEQNSAFNRFGFLSKRDWNLDSTTRDADILMEKICNLPDKILELETELSEVKKLEQGQMIEEFHQVKDEIIEEVGGDFLLGAQIHEFIAQKLGIKITEPDQVLELN